MNVLDVIDDLDEVMAYEDGKSIKPKSLRLYIKPELLSFAHFHLVSPV